MACAVALALLSAVGATTPVGTAMHYDSGVMRQVAVARGMPLWAGVAGYASTPDCALVDPAHPRTILARLWEHGRWGRWARYEVLDCTATRDRASQRRKGIVPYGAEFNYSVADAGGWAWNGTHGAGRTRVQVIGP
jgi:hypothetical protein